MSLFTEKLKNITLVELLLLVILLFLFQTIFNIFNICRMDSVGVYCFIIMFFIIRLKDTLFTIKHDIAEVFLFRHLKIIFVVVLLNIFLSYGFLYLADYLLSLFPNLYFLISFFTPVNSIIGVTFLSTVFISPVCEELIFRGVFLNRFKLFISTIFAVVISSLIFASLHSFGNILSSFVFALSMAILFLKTDNIFIPIFAHFLNNLIAESILVFDRDMVLFNNLFVVSVMSILGIVSFILISIWIIKQLNTIKD